MQYTQVTKNVHNVLLSSLSLLQVLAILHNLLLKLIISGEPDLPRPGLNPSGATYKEYLAALDRGDRLEDTPEHNWSTFLTRPKMLAWMVSHCGTFSGKIILYKV